MQMWTIFLILEIIEKVDCPPVTTKLVPTIGCEGEDILLLTGDSEGQERLLYYEWYYNFTKMICRSANSDGFVVNNPYKSKVEQCNTRGILLKNLSLNDTGDYLLTFVRDGMGETKKTLSLRVSDSPTKQCKPIIGHHSENMLYCSTSCGYLHTVWSLNKTGLRVGNGSLLDMNCSLKGEDVSCCLQGPNMKCHKGDTSELCASVKSSSCSEIHSTKAPNSSDMIDLWLYSVIGTVIIIICIMVIITYCWWMKRKKRQQTVFQLATKQAADPTHIQLPEISLQQLEKREAEDSTSPQPSEETVHLFEEETACATNPQLSEETVPLLEAIEAARSVHTQLSDPQHETEEATTEHQPSTNSETLRELQELRHAALCKICFANKMSMVFTPCNHIATCFNCSTSLQNCPVCRALIEEKMTIHFD